MKQRKYKTAAQHLLQEQDKGCGASLGVQTETPLALTTSNKKLEKPNAERLDLMKQEEGIISKK
ncbi:hypothetical protein EXN66_Car018053 [Channa argus]|uniref:Uncharacterized protein n=1 Tax=Channa argus TaxID=215402 RepID=A0A6G1QIJ0_CHAAH|nr:hypothetical protein EXN66_Car018053 [Channa argus]